DTLLAFVCTAGMYLGTMSGSIISGVVFGTTSFLDYSNDFYKLTNVLAIKFFIESFVALLWTNVVFMKFKDSSKLQQVGLSWIGLFLLFTVFNSVFYIYDLLAAGKIQYSLISIGLDFLKISAYGVVNSVYGAIYMLMNPIDYLVTLFKLTEGNQFVMVKEFPKWSVLLAAAMLVYIPTLGDGFSSLVQTPQDR
uniref:hypothetical protein n=1 Tax=Vibrio penaeicida TaxID=104609 RepID=UPI00142DF606